MKKTLCALMLVAAATTLPASIVPIWGTTENAYLVQIDALTGNTHVVGNTTYLGNNVMLNDIAIDNDGNMWGITHTAFYRVDRTTGALTLIGNHTIQSGAGLGIASDGFTVLGVGSGSDRLHIINTTNGSSAPFPGPGMGTMASGDIATHQGRLFLTSTGDSTGGHRLAEIDPLTGNLLGVFGPAEYGANIWPAKGVASGSNGILYIGSLNRVIAVPTSGPNFGLAGSMVTLNIVSGAAVGPDGLGQIRGLASELPEPGTLALAGAALAALGLSRRRR